ncbi:hypothetical protein CERSUDRAFT_127353, partial [Gelatoporia subvermispora B]
MREVGKRWQSRGANLSTCGSTLADYGYISAAPGRTKSLVRLGTIRDILRPPVSMRAGSPEDSSEAPIGSTHLRCTRRHADVDMYDCAASLRRATLRT